MFTTRLNRRQWAAATIGLLQPCLEGRGTIVRAPEASGGDDTAALQRTIDRLGIGDTLTGGAREYVITRLMLKSGIRMQGFRLKAKGSATPLDAVITIDGNRQTARDIVIEDVHIDGNRVAQRNLISEEDGGRDGFRIVGRAEQMLIANCSAVNCATDGLKLFSHKSLSHDDSRLNFRDIYVLHSRFLRNRRHGASGDSLRNVHFVDCEFSGNGVDSPGAKSEGERGAVDAGSIYGAGIDIEGYGVGSGVDGLFFYNCRAERNARFGFQFWEPTPPGTPLFVPRGNIVFEGCAADGGVSPKHGHQALELSQPKSIRGKLPTYEAVQVIDLECKGTVILNGVRDARFAGGHYRSPYPGFWGRGEWCSGLQFVGLDTEGKIFAEA